jgi:hypothetical protein
VDRQHGLDAAVWTVESIDLHVFVIDRGNFQ